MPPKSNVPIRICGSKTRSGCKTCKQRHVKCDEQKPVCSRCSKAKRQCLYEDPPLQKSRPEPPNPLTKSISAYGPHESSDIKAVKHFHSIVGLELAGGFSNEIWSSIIPRVAQYEPSIWYAVTAIGLLDGDCRAGATAGTVISTNKYVKAMQELQLRLESPSSTCRQDVILLSCLLLAIFECLRNNVHAALRHIGGGMKLLIKWQNEARASNNAYLSRKKLLPVFLSLDSQAIQMGVVDFRDYGTTTLIDEHPPSCIKFVSVEDAHLSLNSIFNRFSHWAIWNEPSDGFGSKPSREWLTKERHSIQEQLVSWDAGFEVLLSITHFEPAVLLLAVQRKVLHAFFGKEVDGPSELEWDKYFPIFREAVENAEAYMALTRKDYQPYSFDIEAHHPRRQLTVSMDIVMSLFVISTRCRNGHLRRRALKMLRSCDRKEGIWDSYMCSLLAERIIDSEEKAALANGFIPESARIYEIDVRLEEDQVAAITYKRLIRDESGNYRREAVEMLAS